MNIFSLILTTLIFWEIFVFILGLALIIIFQLLTGKVNADGLLRDKSGARGFSPARLQLLVLTILGASYYLLLILDNAEADTFPPIPNALVLVLGGSNSIYLVGKLYSSFRDRLDPLLSRTQTERGR